jgi:asparagine synthase (glutamine-hydrolysing)
MNNYLKELSSSISHAVASSIEGKDKIAILFSGGLDSSLIAYLAKSYKNDGQIILYTVGTSESLDLINAKESSNLLGMNWKGIEIQKEEILLAIPELSKLIGSHHPVKISFELPFYLALSRINERLIISGQGADELFGGYARYLKMNKEELGKALKNDLRALIEKDIKMDFNIAEHFKKTLITPYLEENVVRITKKIPIEYKVNNNQRKIILKDVALQIGLPFQIVKREKKAAQYSSGIMKELRKTAKKKGIKVNELIEDLVRY